ncbi:MAG: immunoglobulin domain-containing protein [Verrucomicrobiota bacterium]
MNSGLALGSYSLLAVATDASQLTATSAVVRVTMESPGLTLIDFEGVDASAGPVDASNYLAQFGVKATNVTTNTSLVVADDQEFLGGGVVTASSGNNFLTQTGANGAVSYTLLFSQPYASVSWVRTELPAGTTGASLPGWRAHIFDGQGNELGSAGENALGSYTNVPAARFTLLGKNIFSIRFDGNNQGVSSLSTLPLDDLLLSTIPTNTTLAVSLTNQAGTVLAAPGTVVLGATVTDTVGTVSQVNFYEGSNFLSSAAVSGEAASLTLNHLAKGTYVFTAEASDSVGAVITSIPLTNTVAPVTGVSVINFDQLDTSAGTVGGAVLSNYLSTNFGVTLSNVTVGSAMEAVSGGVVTGSGGAVASSPPNYFTQAGLNQPVSFTLVFQSPLQAFGFTRVALLAGSGGVSHPQWTATTLDANGTQLGSAGENLITSTTNVPARSFVLTGLNGDGIASVRFDSDSRQTAAFSAVLLDDLILNAANASAIPPLLSVSLTTTLPASGTSQVPVTNTLTAAVTDNLGVSNSASTNYSVSFYAGPNLLGTVAYPLTSFTLTNVLAGTYIFRAQVVDGSGVTAYSGPVTNTVAVTGGNSKVVNFDSLNTAKGPVPGAVLSNYLATNGIILTTNITPGTGLAVENQATFNGGGVVAASSPPNFVTQIGGSGPVSYTLNFTTPLTNFGFTRPELLANPFVSQPAWQATAFDAAGVALTNAGEGLIGSYTNVGAQVFTLSGPGIASVQFASQGSGLTTFNAMVADDFVLTTNAAGVKFPPAVAITSPPAGLQIISPAALTVAAQAVDPAGIASVSFYANNTFIGSAASSPYSVQWTNAAGTPLGAGGYALTAVALDSNNFSRISPVVNVTILPSEVGAGFAIVTPPASQTAKLGSSVTLSVTTTGTGSVTYQWYQNGTMLTGQTESTLTLFPVTNADAGSYTVTATSGGTTLTSTPPAVLTVAPVPVIETPPLGQTVAIGANVVLSVVLNMAASGDGPFTYQWLRNGANLPGATNSTYSILAAQPLNSGSYQVVVANSLAFVESAPAALVVQSGNSSAQTVNNDLFANRIRINPLLGPVLGNNQNATSEPGEPLHDGKPGGKSIWYTWTASFTGVISLGTQGSDFDTLLAIYTGTNISRLTPVAADDDSGGFLTSLVTFNVKAGTTYQIAVDGFKGASGNVVLGMPSGTAYRVLTASSGSSVPVITSQPASQLVPAGANVTLRVGASNALTYQWFFQGAPVEAGGTRSSLAITNFRAGSVGLYNVLVANAAGSVQSEQASLQIAATNQPGSGGLVYLKFGDAVDAATNSTTAKSPGPSSGGGDTRGYSVSQVFSTVGATKEPGEPDHCGQAGGASEWFVYTAPASGTLVANTAGSSYNTILAVYSGPGTNFASLVPQACGFVTNYQQQGQPSVVLSGVPAQTRFFIAVDGYQGASGTVQLNIGLGSAPALVSPPASQVVAPGSNATFSVMAIGSTNFGYQWQLNGTNIPKATSASYAVANASAANVGSYSVVVSNVVATVTSAPPATLTLQYAPAITAQPASQTVYLGQKAGFAVTAVGVNVKTNLLHYQWYNGNNTNTNSIAVAKATNSTLAFPVTQYTNNGSYFVTVSNSYGAANSANVVLTVLDTNAPTVAFTSPKDGFTTNTSTVTVTGTASDIVGLSSVQVNGTNVVKWTNFGTLTANWTNVVTLVPGTNIITAQSVDVAGNKSAPAKLHIVYLVTSQLTVKTNLGGVGKVTSTSGATNGASLIISNSYTILATPGSNYLFTNWTSGAGSSPLTNYPGGTNLTFTMYSNMVLQANFVTNPFLAVAGVYNGLFYPTNGVTEASSGFISATISSNSAGTYTAKLLLNGGSNSFNGSFDLTGTAQASLTNSGQTIGVTLSLDFNPAEARMGGSVSNAAAGWNAVIYADRAVFSTNANPATNYAGHFTLLLPPGINAPALSPDGYGYAAITNTLGGISTLGGALADGTPFLWSVPIDQDGGIPLYQSLYSGKGTLLGWIYFTNEPPQNLSTNSSFSWIKPSIPGTLYPSGFTNLITNGVPGSPYTNTAGLPVLDLTNATLTLSYGNLTNGTLTFTNLDLNEIPLTNLAGGTKFGPTNYLVLAINTNNGIVTVTFQATGAKTNTAHGAVLQNQTNAAGYFLGTNQTGSFILH